MASTNLFVGAGIKSTATFIPAGHSQLYVGNIFSNLFFFLFLAIQYIYVYCQSYIYFTFVHELLLLFFFYFFFFLIQTGLC